MANYTLQFEKTDTLASSMAAGAAAFTLTSGNFGSPSGVQFYVFDYDVPASAEVVKAAVAGTAGTSATRAQDGTSDVIHAAGAKVGAFFIPSHYNALKNAIGAKVANTGPTQSITSGVLTKLAFDTEASPNFDSDTMHDTVTNNSRLTVVTPGKYTVIMNGIITGAAGGTQRVGKFTVNNTTDYGAFISGPLGGNTLYVSGSVTLDLAAADYVEFQYLQDSGGNLNITAQFSAIKIGV